MQRWIDRISLLVQVGPQTVIAVSFVWLLWNKPLRETWAALLNMSASSALQAMCAGGVIALSVHFLQRRYVFLSTSAYDLLDHLVKQPYRDNFRQLRAALKGISFTGFFITFGRRDHRLHEKAEQWLSRLMALLLWPIACVTLAFWVNGDNQDQPVTLNALDALWVGALMPILALLGVRLHYILATSLLALWLGYTGSTQGGVQASAQAAVIGLSIAMWSLWQGWLKKINQGFQVQ